MRESGRPVDTNYRSFFKKIDNYILGKIGPDNASKNEKSRIWRDSFYIYVCSKTSFHDECMEDLHTMQEWVDSKNKWSFERYYFMKRGREVLVTQFNEDFASLDRMVDKFKRYVDVILERKPVSGTVSIRPPPPETESQRELINGKNSRKRHHWREEEDVILLSRMKVGKSWVEISRSITTTPPRTNVDCKDRWKILMKQVLRRYAYSRVWRRKGVCLPQTKHATKLIGQ